MVQLHRVQPGELRVGGRNLKSACTWTLKGGGGGDHLNFKKKDKKEKLFAIFINVLEVIYLPSRLIFPFPLGDNAPADVMLYL